MRLEHLCAMQLAYREERASGGAFVMVRPYGTEEGTGYGEMDGTVTGERLQGTVRCVNHPHRRSDGTMLPDLHGVIRTNDGVLVMMTVQGRTVFEGENGRQLLTVIFEAQDPRYRWLNTIWCVLEGVITAQPQPVRIYMCVNELA